MQKKNAIINYYAYLSSGFIIMKVHQAPSIAFDLSRIQKPTREPNIKL